MDDPTFNICVRNAVSNIVVRMEVDIVTQLNIKTQVRVAARKQIRVKDMQFYFSRILLSNVSEIED